MEQCKTIAEFSKKYECVVRLNKTAINHKIKISLSRRVVDVYCPLPQDEQYVLSYIYKHIIFIENRLLRDNVTVPTFEEGSKVNLFSREYTVRFYEGSDVTVIDDELLVPIEDAKNALIGYLQNRLHDIMQEKTNKACSVYGVRCPKIDIMANRSQWGFCRNGGEQINYNIALSFCKEEILDYLAAHEASHILFAGHQPDFWHSVERLCPAYKTMREEIKKYDLDALLDILAR